MRCVALCVLLCLPAALHAAKAPIRIMGTLATSPTVAPHYSMWSPNVPCRWLTDEGNWPCNRGGYPSFKGWMANLTRDARGTVKFMTPDYRSRTVLAHPDEILLNYGVWTGLDVDFVTMRNEYMLTSRTSPLELTRFMEMSPRPFVLSNFLVGGRFGFVSDLMDAMHIKVIDGVSVGILVVWVGSPFALSLPNVLPVMTARMRYKGVDKIVVFMTGLSSAGGMEEAARKATLVMAANDIDVVVRDIAPETGPFVENGTTVLTSRPSNSVRNDLLVVEMVQDGSLWQYTLRVLHLNERPVALYNDPVYEAAKTWIEVEMERSKANDITVVNVTVPLPPASESKGVYFCNRMECELGVLTADAMRERAGTQMALTNSASARGYDGWPVGPVKRSTLWRTYPFANTVCQVNVSATLLLDMLNFGVDGLLPNGTHNPETRGGHFPQISGFRFTLNPKLPRERRVVSVEVEQPDGTFEPLEKRRVYSIALTDYVLAGGAGYSMIPGNFAHSECLVTTMMEATQEHLMRQKTYAPYTDGRTTFDYDGVALLMKNQSFGNCTELEKHDAFWQDCVPCNAGLWRPDATSNVCVERVSDSVNVFMIVGIVVGVMLVLSIPLVWKMTEKQRRINALYNNNKVAEECAVAVMELRLSDLDYLNELEKPNKIQSAFIAIVKQMKVYMEFMPKNLIANYQPTDVETAEMSFTQSVGSTSVHSFKSASSKSMSASRRPGATAGEVKCNYARKKRISILALNSRSYTSKCEALETEGVRVIHSQLIESFNAVVENFKGLAESMCGDRLLAAWNTVVERHSHCAFACKAAFQMRTLKEDGITPHVGLASGTATFGLFGGTGTKKYDIVGTIVSGAMLLALLNKDYGTQCLFPHTMVHEASILFYVYIVDYISHSKLETSFVYEIADKKGEAATDEWMYQLEAAEKADPYKTRNDQWKAFMKTGRIEPETDLLQGKLLQLKNDAVSGEYCCTCPGLEQF